MELAGDLYEREDLFSRTFTFLGYDHSVALPRSCATASWRCAHNVDVSVSTLGAASRVVAWAPRAKRSVGVRNASLNCLGKYRSRTIGMQRCQNVRHDGQDEGNSEGCDRLQVPMSHQNMALVQPPRRGTSVLGSSSSSSSRRATTSI